MSKRKKKSAKHIHWKITKAQHKKNFFNTIQYICSAGGRTDVYKMIPESNLEYIYDNRVQTFKFRAAKDNVVPTEKIKDLNVLFPHLLKDYTIPILKNGPAISLDKFFTVGMSLLCYLDNLHENDYHNASIVKQYLEQFLMFKEGGDVAVMQLNNIMQTFSFIESDLSSQLYWLSLDITAKYNSVAGSQYVIEVHSHTPEQIHVTFDNIPRPAVRVGWGVAERGIRYITIKPKDLGIESSFSELPLDVYIQTHALIRLKERIDCIGP